MISNTIASTGANRRSPADTFSLLACLAGVCVVVLVFFFLLTQLSIPTPGIAAVYSPEPDPRWRGDAPFGGSPDRQSPSTSGSGFPIAAEGSLTPSQAASVGAMSYGVTARLTDFGLSPAPANITGT